MDRTADVVVIGAGIAGTATAYYLAKGGASVIVCEKGEVAGEQSSRNWGWCRQQNRDARELPISTKSLALWEEFGAESGEDTGFRRCGLFYLSDNEAELAGWARWRDFAITAGVTTDMLSADAVPAPAIRSTAAPSADAGETRPAAIGRPLFRGCSRSRARSPTSLTRYIALDSAQKMPNAPPARATAPGSRSCSPNTSPAKTTRFFVH